MEALVTGANGFIGSFLVQALLARGRQVRCFVLEGESLNWIEGLSVRIIRGDVSIGDMLVEAVEGVDYIYHLAGVKTVWDEAAYFRVNFQGTKNVVDAAIAGNRHLKRFVLVSSQSAAGPSLDGHPVTEDEPCHPVTVYGKSKRSAEVYVEARRGEVPSTIVRPALVYGPRNIETAMLYDLIRYRLKPHFIHHEQNINLIHVRDTVDGIVRAAESDRAEGQTYFITSEEPRTWEQIAGRAFEMSGRIGLRVPVPWGGVKFAAGVVKSLRKLRGQPTSLIDDKMREMSQRHWVCSGEKARCELGFVPRIPLDEGIRETLEWFKGGRR